MHLDQTWKCPCCGEKMSGLQNSFAAYYPDNWTSPSKVEEQSSLTSDLCKIVDVDESVEYYIRCTIEFPIIGSSEVLTYGLWASVSEKSFQTYESGLERNKYGEEGCFAYLGNKFPCVDGTFGLHADLYFPIDNCRPTLFLHDSAHVLVEMQENGVSKELLIQINSLFTKH